MGTTVNFSEARKRAEEMGLIGSGSVFKPKDGLNRIRLVSECLDHPGEFKGPEPPPVPARYGSVPEELRPQLQ